MLTRLFVQTACLVSMLTLAYGGCAVTIDPTDLDPNNADGGAATGVITIRIVNQTSHTLDPQIYVSAQPVSVSDLFRSSRKYTDYGVGRQGLIAAYTSDDFDLDCAQARVIGTRGGVFGGGEDDNDLNNPAGSGTQLVLTQDLVFYCGARITLTYRETSGGFTTAFSVAQ
jgi:hypothetical protein